MAVVAYLLGFLAVCYAQAPKPCESPKQWEGDRFLVDSSKHFSERARIHYDEVNQRIKTEDKIDEGREREYVSSLRLFNTKKEYRVNLLTKKCNVTTLDYAFRPIGVPSGSRLIFEAELGAAQIPFEHLSIATFFGNATEDHVRYSTVVTIPDCIPIGDNYYNDVTGYVESRYFNIHAGINSTSVFDIPPECKTI